MEHCELLERFFSEGTGTVDKIDRVLGISYFFERKRSEIQKKRLKSPPKFSKSKNSES